MMMTCEKVTERLSEYWSGELDPMTQKALDEHLRHCDACQREWVTFQAAMTALRQVPVPPPPADLPRRIRAAIAQRPLQRQPVRWWQWSVAFAGAAAVLILTLALPIFRSVREKVQLALEVAQEPFPQARSTPMIAQQTAPAPLPLRPQMKRQSMPRLAQALPPSPKEPLRSRVKMRPPLPSAKTPFEELPQSTKMPLFTPPPSPPTAPPAEEIPKEAEMPVDIDVSPPATQAPQIASIPSRQRQPSSIFAEATPHREERQRETEGPQGPMGPAAIAKPAPPIPVPPGTSGFGGLGSGGQGKQAIAQFGGGHLPQTLVPLPVQLQWHRFEPVVVNKTSVWILTLRTDTPQVVTVTVKPGDRVEVLNTDLSASEPEGQRLWKDKIPAQKSVEIRLLVRATDIGARRLLLTAHTQDGKVVAWWFVFAATDKREPPAFNRAINLQTDRWTLLELLTHLAWETKTAFIIPDPLGSLSVVVPTGNQLPMDLLSALGQQLDGRWQRTGSGFVWTGKNIPLPKAEPSVITPKEQ